MMMSKLVFALVFLVYPFLSSARHVITFRSSTSLQPSSLAWDPIAQHFVVGSVSGPTIHAISDAGVVEHLLSDPSTTGADGSATSVAVDPVRRRLIVGFSNPGSIAAYDLKSYERIFAVPLPEMDTIPGGVAVDLRSGEAFVSSTKRGVVWKVGLDGAVRVISESKIFGSQGLGGVVHVGRGYLLIVQAEMGKIFKVDSDDGAAKEVLSSGSSKPLVSAGHAIALHPDLSLIVATNRSVLLVKSDDSWAQAAVHDKSDLGDGVTAVAVAIREGKKAYVLVKSQEGYRIEEVAWERESEGDMVWGLVLIGLGLAYFMFWRFQMGKLVGNMNKKQA
ncbi:Calcium-dependent phosphotriesterase superfamily protein [Rhynchospora pubera]|uniref:Calcium-dependent phosphotriesterase superfamily protein n=1 Tax=Rhynchospora pubera TaxID=906938 RepID=A0AAV8DQQ2_9POAL|nr:Calcium-dependent phosphotriesterase superfamily protein [Rhynchospora pubera]